MVQEDRLEVNMLKRLLVIVLGVGCFQQALATAMSEDLSRCLELKKIATQHQTWKSDFERYQKDNFLNADEKFELQKITLRVVLNRLKLVQNLADLNRSNSGLIRDTVRFLYALEKDTITPASARKVMTSALPKFERTIDEALKLASESNKSCEILPLSDSL